MSRTDTSVDSDVQDAVKNAMRRAVELDQRGEPDAAERAVAEEGREIRGALAAAAGTTVFEGAVPWSARRQAVWVSRTAMKFDRVGLEDPIDRAFETRADALAAAVEFTAANAE